MRGCTAKLVHPPNANETAKLEISSSHYTALRTKKQHTQCSVVRIQAANVADNA